MLIVHDLKQKTRFWHSNRTLGPYHSLPGQIIMKFGEQLRTSVIKEYQWYYIAYNDLKDQLKTDFETPPTKAKPRPKRKEWTPENEERFVETLYQELDKVYTKQKVKAIEIGRRIAAAEKEVKDVVSRLDQRGPVTADGQGVDLSLIHI